MGARVGANISCSPHPKRRCLTFVFVDEGTVRGSLCAGLDGRGEMPQETGLWWCHSKEPSALLSDWGQPVQIMTAEDRGWHAGPWKPSLQFDSDANQRGFVFFDGSYRTADPGPFPYVFTLGCAEVDLRT